MAPRSLPTMLACFSTDAAPLAKEGAHGEQKPRRRRWTGEIKRKILAPAAARRPRVRAVAEEQTYDDVAVVDKQIRPEREVEEEQRAGGPVSKKDGSPRHDGAPPEAVAVAVVAVRRKRKGLRVRFDLPPKEETGAAPVGGFHLPPAGEETSAAPVRSFHLPPAGEKEASAAPVVPRFPTGVLGKPPESFALSGPEMTAAFLMSVTAAAAGKRGGADSATATPPIDHDLVARWTARKEACARRLRYLRDYCPFQREEEQDEQEEDEESATETTTLPAEHDHEEEAPRMSTGLPFDSPEAEAEFVRAIRSRYLYKDDLISRYAYERSRKQYMLQQSLMAAGEGSSEDVL